MSTNEKSADHNTESHQHTQKEKDTGKDQNPGEGMPCRLNEPLFNSIRGYQIGYNLVCKLIDALPTAAFDVSDEEVVEREQKLEAGEIEELSQDEFVRRVRKERGR